MVFPSFFIIVPPKSSKIVNKFKYLLIFVDGINEETNRNSITPSLHVLIYLIMFFFFIQRIKINFDTRAIFANSEFFDKFGQKDFRRIFFMCCTFSLSLRFFIVRYKINTYIAVLFIFLPLILVGLRGVPATPVAFQINF